MNLEQTILKSLILNEDYLRKVIPFLKSEYFQNTVEKTLFDEILSFTNAYNKVPTVEAIDLAVQEKLNLTAKELEECQSLLKNFVVGEDKPSDIQWLTNKTESFCQEKAIYNAILNSITILDGKDKHHNKGAIPKILSDALSVCFDASVGHDYLDDSDARFDFYHRKESHIPFDLEYFNKITKGGLKPKTLNVALAGVGVGKSLFMCHVASGCLVQGYNVLYITMEMSEEEIAARIDANLLNVNMNDLLSLPKDIYQKKIDRVRDKTHGKLVIKEYPTASASTIHFRNLLNELNLKRNFIPTIIFVDYLNICCSARIKPGANINSYTYVKAIAEELRGLAVEHNVPIVSATQTTRSGFTSSDPGLEDTSESFGLPATADLMFALIVTEDLDALGQMMVKQLKNRYADPTFHKRFVVGIDRAKMRLFDVEQSGQLHLTDAGDVIPNAKKETSGFTI